MDTLTNMDITVPLMQDVLTLRVDLHASVLWGLTLLIEETSHQLVQVQIVVYSRAAKEQILMKSFTL